MRTIVKPAEWLDVERVLEKLTFNIRKTITRNYTFFRKGILLKISEPSPAHR